MNIYFDIDDEVSIFVDVNIVYQVGELLLCCFWFKKGWDFMLIVLEIFYDGKVFKLIEVDFGLVDNEVYISFDGFEFQFDVYELIVKVIFGKDMIFIEIVELFYLLYLEDYGSVLRLDDFYGGFYVQCGKDELWQVIFFYIYYCKLIQV